MREVLDPYRTPAPIEVDPTAPELAFWDRVFCNALNKGCSLEACVDIADQALRVRRERFGQR